MAAVCQEWDLATHGHTVAYLFIYANLAILVTALSVLLVTRCISQILGGLVAFR